MTSADFSELLQGNPRPPQVKAYSFILFPMHLQIRVYWLRALQRCACLPSLVCLICISCSSVQKFVVSLPSVQTSRLTTLRLTNRLHQLAYKGLTPSGILSATHSVYNLFVIPSTFICIFGIYSKLAAVCASCLCWAHTSAIRHAAISCIFDN